MAPFGIGLTNWAVGGEGSSSAAASIWSATSAKGPTSWVMTLVSATFSPPAVPGHGVVSACAWRTMSRICWVSSWIFWTFTFGAGAGGGGGGVGVGGRGTDAQAGTQISTPGVLVI